MATLEKDWKVSRCWELVFYLLQMFGDATVLFYQWGFFYFCVKSFIFYARSSPILYAVIEAFIAVLFRFLLSRLLFYWLNRFILSIENYIPFVIKKIMYFTRIRQNYNPDSLLPLSLRRWHRTNRRWQRLMLRWIIIRIIQIY